MSPDPQRHAPPPAVSDRSLAATAAHWVARCDAGLSEAERQELRAWVRADPRHAKALAATNTHSSALDWAVYTGVAERVTAGLEKRARRRKARRQLVGTACAALLLLGAGVFFSKTGSQRIEDTIVVHAPREQILPDGSRMELGEGAQVSVAFNATERRIELLKGSAHFDVRKDPNRPFLVSAGDITARAVGTAFALGIEAQQVALVVTEGRVAVDYHHPAAAGTTVGGTSAQLLPAKSADDTLALVQAGESVAVRRNTAIQAAPVVTSLPSTEWNNRLTWRIPRLEFASTPLSEVVKTINRYNRDQLVITDSALANLKLSGALRADRIDGLLEILELEFNIGATRSDGRILLQQNR